MRTEETQIYKKFTGVTCRITVTCKVKNDEKLAL